MLINFTFAAFPQYYFNNEEIRLAKASEEGEKGLNENGSESSVKYTTPSQISVKVSNKINIKVSAGSYHELLTCVQKYNSFNSIEPISGLDGWYTLTFNTRPDDIINLSSELYNLTYVIEAEPEFISCVPNGHGITYDPMVSEQWALYNSINKGVDINVNSAWNYAAGINITGAIDVEPIYIGVIDTKIDRWINELRNQHVNSQLGYTSLDFNDYEDVPSVTHGTNIAGIIVAKQHNNIGISGVAPMACIESEPIDFENVTSTEIAQAIKRLTDKNCFIINCSFSTAYSSIIKDAIDYAVNTGRRGHGTVIVASAGDSNSSNLPYPAAHPNVIAVGAIDNQGKRWAKSNFGNNIDLVAPGVNILTTNPRNDYTYIDGTSASAAYVSGVIALILEIDTYIDFTKLRSILRKSANRKSLYSGNWTSTEDGQRSPQYGYGLVDAYNAIMLCIESNN